MNDRITMNDHTEWDAKSEITLELQQRLCDDRGLFVQFSPETPKQALELRAPVVEIRDEIAAGDIKYSAPQLVGKICKLLNGDLSQIIEIGPVDVSAGTAYVSVRTHKLKAQTRQEKAHG